MKKEIGLSLGYKIGGMSLSFIAISLLIQNVGVGTYGVWATLISLLAWLQLSDFGVGYALKNRIASGDNPKELLNLTIGVFQFYIVISCVIAVLFVFLGDYSDLVRQYKTETMILYLGMILFFPLTVGSAILQGMQKNSISNFMMFVQSLLWLACVYLWSHGATLMALSILYISTVLVIAFFQYIWGLHLLTKHIREAFVEIKNYKNFYLAIPLWGIGVRFVVLQLTSIILFSLGTYLTYSNLSPEAAAKYDVLFKFFQIFLTGFGIILSVYWPSISQAIGQSNHATLKRKFIELHLISFSVSVAALLFATIIAQPLIDIYSHHKIHISMHEALVFCGFISIQMFAYSGAVFLNAAEQLKGQMFWAVFAAIFLVPLALYFYSMGIGFSSVPLATALLIVPSLFYCNWRAYFYVVKKLA